MKKIISFALLVSSALWGLCSCTATLPSRFDAFVSSVEKNYSEFSEDEWNAANEKFEEFYQQYQENKSSYNSEEKKQINSAIVRYGKVIAKSGVEEVAGVFEDITSQIPILIDEAKNFLEELGLTKSSESVVEE